MSSAVVTNELDGSVKPGKAASFLMCAPTLYDVDYVINPWMKGNVHAASRDRALLQWQALYEAVRRLTEVRLIEPQNGSPDMVFTANAGLERDGLVVLSSFFHAERQGEEAHFRRWFSEAGYKVIELPRGVAFEGEGDALFSEDGQRLWIGFGTRTLIESHARVGEVWGASVSSLRLIDPRFYHLDTCFAPLADGYVLFYPEAFDEPSRRLIEQFYPLNKRIVVGEADALRFACNAIIIGQTMLMNRVSDDLVARLQLCGFRPALLDLSEFLKAGGAAKCLVMKLSSLD